MSSPVLSRMITPMPGSHSMKCVSFLSVVCLNNINNSLFHISQINRWYTGIVRDQGKESFTMRKLSVKRNKIMNIKSKLVVLKHISKRNCALLPYLDDESLHTLGEFIYNVITQRVKLDNKQIKKVKKILEKDKHFYKKLIDVDTDDPLGYFKQTLKVDPHVGQGIVSLIAALAPLISFLILQ